MFQGTGRGAWCWLSPGLTGSLPITFTQRSPGGGVRSSPLPPLHHWWWAPVPAMEGNTNSCFCNVKYLCQQLGCRAAPRPGGLSTPAPLSGSVGIYELHIHLSFFFPPPSCEMQSQKSVCMLLHLAQPPDLSGWRMPQTCWGLSLGPSVCPVSPRPCHGAVAVSGVPVPQPAAQGAVRSMRSVHASYL